MDAAPLVVAVGMTREARIVQHPHVTVIVSGGQVALLAEQLECALRRGVAGVVSFGLCGGLDPSLKTGDCLIGAAVIDDGERIAADASWTERLSGALPNAVRAKIAGENTVIADASAKAALRARHGAVAVDMESHVVARLARRHETPFAILRAICDQANEALPRSAQTGLRADGEPDIWAVVRALLGSPGELPALLRTAREADAAIRSLRDARHLLGPGLGCPNVFEHLVDVT